MTSLSNWRVNYPDRPITIHALNACPFTMLAEWLDQAAREGVVEANAMSLATVNQGLPEVRMVLLKDITSQGLVFFTHYNSPKGRQLAETPYAALCFWWPQSHRQVRVNGPVKQLSPAASDRYFATRDRNTRISTWASRQSAPLDNYETLIENFTIQQQRFGNQQVPRPPHWGGYQLMPTCFEFWQGRQSRLHDRIAFRQQGRGWQCWRLSP